MGVAYGHLHPHLLLVGESQSEKGDIRIAVWSRSGGSLCSASSGQSKNSFLHIVTISLWWVLVGSLLRQETGLSFTLLLTEPSFAQQVTEMKTCTSSGDAVIHECDKPSATPAASCTTAWLRWAGSGGCRGSLSGFNPSNTRWMML